MSSAHQSALRYWSRSSGWSDIPWPRRSSATRRNSSARGLSTWRLQHMWLPDQPWIISTGWASAGPHSRTCRACPAPPITVWTVPAVRPASWVVVMTMLLSGDAVRLRPRTSVVARPDRQLSRACPAAGLRCRMQFRLLGPLEVQGDDGVVRIGSGVQGRLLAVLRVEARSVVSADRLVDLVWGSRPPADARQSLWTCVARLRRALAEPAGPAAEELLVTRPPGYLLAAGPDQIDADQFVQLASAASGIAADRPDAAAELLDRALGLWRGPALQEFADEPFAEVE